MYLRANPDLELVPIERLSAEEYRLIDDGNTPGTTYGVLRSLSGCATLKVVDTEVALVFLTLRTPGPIPHYIRNSYGDGVKAVTDRLVGQGIIQWCSDSGHGVRSTELSGASADARATTIAGNDRLAQLSREALAFGATLHFEDAGFLAARLYFYGRVPKNGGQPQREQPWPASAHQLLRRHWSRQTAADEGWHQWRRKGNKAESVVKLYVSPWHTELDEILPLIVHVATTTGAVMVKLGAGSEGVRRPDKLMLYFSSQEALGKAAEALASVGSVRPHGVSFTSQWKPDLPWLSWSRDPPSDCRIPWQGRLSWRYWVTTQLAVGLIEARNRGLGEEAQVDWALRRVRNRGVSTQTWLPSEQTQW